MANQDLSGGTSQTTLGAAPNVDAALKPGNRTISSINQAISVCENMISDWKEGISHAARITAKINGERPYNQKAREKNGKGWMTNVSTGFLATECSKVIPRFFMPIKTAKYLTAAELPSGYPNGTEKAQHFRQVITETVRGWDKFNFYIRGLAREVGIWGFAFNAFLDEYEWRPTLFRMDRGFVPQGTEIMDEPVFFLAKYDYKVSELFDLLNASVSAGRAEWKKDAVVKAINEAMAPSRDSTVYEARSYEDMVRQATVGFSYSKGVRVIKTWHLFAKETNGRVSRYILVADPSSRETTVENDPRLLYEGLDQFASMKEAVVPTVFDYGDGTIHGCWGAGHILYDLAVQVEKIRCDSIDNIRLTNKVKIQVPDAKNVNDVKQLVNDQFVVVSGGQFAGNTAGLTSDTAGYAALDDKLSMLAQQKIGAFIPPIPSQPSDIKAAQINAAMMKEKELQEALLENWLIQWAEVVRVMIKRLVNPESPDPVAKEVQARLLEKLTPEEIMLLTNQFPVKSIIDFTEQRAQMRGTFAASVVNNPLFNQNTVARIMAEGAGDEKFVSAIVNQEGDGTSNSTAQRQQIMENTTMLTRATQIPVVSTDNDWVHMETVKPELEGVLQDPNAQTAVADALLRHYAAHWEAGVAKKTLPKDKINDSKSWIASAEKAVTALAQRDAIRQQQAQMVAQAEQQAAQLVASGQA
jgi:hypothetical protein